MINIHFANIFISFVTDGQLHSPAGNLGSSHGNVAPFYKVSKNGGGRGENVATIYSHPDEFPCYIAPTNNRTKALKISVKYFGSVFLE